MGECLDNSRASALFRALSDALAIPLRNCRSLLPARVVERKGASARP